MASTKNQHVHSKTPFFDGSNYGFWKIKMEAYLKALGYDVWLAVKNGYTPSEEDITNPVEKKKCENDTKAVNAF